MSYRADLRVASGHGRLARRGRSCLFVPALADGSADMVAELIEAFRSSNAEPDVAIADYVLARTADAPAFILAVWPDEQSGPGIRLVVRGAVTVSTDIASIPSLSGVGSSTWVEHRVPRNPGTASINVGDDAEAGTDLIDGVVPAGGFELALTDADAIAPTAAIPRPPTSERKQPVPDPEPTESEPEPQPEPTPEPEPEPTQPTSAPSVVARSGLDALRAATAASAPDAEPTTVDAIVPTRPDAEIPAVPRRSVAPPTAPPQFEIPEPAREPDPTIDTPNGPPAFPGEVDPVTAPVTDPEATILPGNVDFEHLDERDDPDRSDGDPDDPPALTHARLCTDRHPNPPFRADCVVCGQRLDTSAPAITIEQPVLAHAVMPDSTRIDVVGTLVLGRNPQLDAAQCDEGDLIAFSAPPSVSRTHAIIRAEGWSITVTDCGSQGGSALLVDGVDEPIALVPWTPHEVAGGDTLYLGGPTAVRIVDVPG